MKRILFFVIFAALIFLSCATQGGNDNESKSHNQSMPMTHNQTHNQTQNTSSISHWIVGTWTQEGGAVWIFNENGTGTAGKENFIFGIFNDSEIYLSNGWGARKIFISPDGKKMIIMGTVFQKN